jgi:hypothetical protein
MTLRALPLIVFLVLLASGCGEKITLPQAEGIAVVSDYTDVTPGTLNEQLGFVTDVEPFGGIFAVSDSAGGRVLLVYDDGRVDTFRDPVEGLRGPIALETDMQRSLLLVVENTGAGYEISAIDTRLEIQGTVPLTAEVQSVSDIASDGDHLYVSDPVARTVHRYAFGAGAGFTALTYAGTVVAEDPEQFDQFSPQVVSIPAGMTVDDAGMLVVCDADTTRNWVLRYDPLPGSGVETDRGQSVIFGPTREELAEGVDAFDQSVRCGDVFSIEASTLGKAPPCNPPADFDADPSDADGEFHEPSGVATDGDGNLYVADRMNGRIQRFTPEGEFDAEFGPGLATGDDALQQPVRLATWDGFAITPAATIDIPGARVFVVDAANGRLRIYEDSRWTPFRNQG